MSEQYRKINEGIDKEKLLSEQFRDIQEQNSQLIRIIEG